MFSEQVNGVLRAVIGSMQTPVIIVLLLLMVIIVVYIGGFAAELLTERRQLKAKIPSLVEEINEADFDEAGKIIENSGLLKRQKAALFKMMNMMTAEAPTETLEGYGRQLLFEEDEHYRKITRGTDIILRIAPMFGLLGTLIPLGPGLLALGEGDIQALSESLLTAFDTTAAGLIIAAIAFVISHIRKGWYRAYIAGLETVMETVLAKEV